MRPDSFPLSITSLGVTAKIRRTAQIKNGRQYHSFIVEFFLFGKRKQEWYSDLTKARQAATEACKRIAQGEQGVLQLNNQDRLVYLRAMELLKPTGMALDMADEYYPKVESDGR